MAYSNFTDLQLLASDADLLQLTDDQGLGSIDQDLITAAISRGDQRIDAFLAKVAVVPVVPVPPLLVQISAKFALIELHLRRQTTLSLAWSEESSRIIRYLEAVSRGVERFPGIVALGLNSPLGAKAKLATGSNYPDLSGYGS